ncbi:Hypp351 [Branchiostoma lanceolatum]|uniref:Hypp351 protein n=1 Tax=Branchiostoma lanceolatum TaxID=7740 RepID=A0A8J9VA42_BRALA|nr:Hypp351 [Branchiostoma lanceolatum]
MAKELNYDDIAQFMSSATGKKDAKPKPDEAEALAKLKVLQDSLERAEKGVKDEDYEKRKQERQKKREEEGKPPKDDDDDEDDDPHGIMGKLMSLATPKNLQVLEKMGIMKKLGPLGGLLKMLVKSNGGKGGSGGGAGGIPGLNTGMLKNLGGMSGMLGGGGGGDSGGGGSSGGFNPALLAGLATQLGGPDLAGAMGGGVRSSRGAVEDVKDDNGLKDLAEQLVKNRGSGYIDCDNPLVWDALLQEEENQEKTIKTCGLCSDDDFLKMHMELFVEHCGYGKGGFPPICFNPAGWENLLYSFKEEQLVKACDLCDNGMFKKVHPEIFGEHCDLDGEEKEDGEDEKEDTRGAAEEEEGEDEKEDTRGAAEEEGGEDEKEDTRGAAEEEGGEDEKEDTRGAAEEEGEEDEKEDTRGAAEEEGGEDEKEDTRGAAEEEGGEDEKEEESREVGEKEEEEEEESREVKADHEEDTRGNKLDLIDKGKDKADDDLVLAVEQFVRDTAKNMEALADSLDRVDKKQKVEEWRP